MAFPADRYTVQITGRYVNLDGTPVQGVVTFTGKASATVTASRTMVVSNTITATLDADGAFAVPLVATDAADLRPNGWTYTVKEDFDGGRTFEMAVPLSAKLTGIDLSMVDATAPSSGTTEAITRFLSRRGLFAAAGAVGAGIAAAPLIGSASAYAGPALSSAPVAARNVAARQTGTTAAIQSLVQPTDIVDDGHSKPSRCARATTAATTTARPATSTAPAESI